IVFDSSTGLPIDGAQVTLIDATGAPAQVFGEDGISTFPATVTSGGTATDSDGNTYDFPPGGYRFPFVIPGTYRLDVVPPSGYDVPSSVPTATLQTLPGAPFAIVEPGSRGEEFILNPGPAFNIDFPVDPVVTSLWVTKSASQDIVSIGDFLQYSVNVQNKTAGVMSAVALTDLLPLGFRYQSGSLKIDGIASPDPAISPDGGTLTLFLGDLAGDTTETIRYVVEVAAGARVGNATNKAFAEAAGGITSNVARARVKVKEELFRSHCLIMGRVIPGGCNDVPDDDDGGVEGVRIYLEDGTYVITDERGMFHFEGVRPGVHVVQLDLDSLPEGTMWRTDFHVALKPRTKGEVGLRLHSTASDDTIAYNVVIEGGAVPIQNLRLSIMLPEDTTYVGGSSRLGDVLLPDPEVNGNVLVYRIGDFQGELKRDLSLKGMVSTGKEIAELITKCMLLFDTPAGNNQRTPLVENLLLLKSEEERIRQPDIVLSPKFDTFSVQLQEEDLVLLNDVVKSLKGLEIVHIYAVGHTDPLLIKPRSHHIFADNYALSWGRARNVVRYLSNALEMAPSQITVLGSGADEPVATNETPEGRALNRRVELRVVTEKVTRKKSIETLKSKDAVSVETKGLRPGETWKTAEVETEKPETIENYGEAWIESAEPGIEWLWPGPSYSPPIPSCKLAFKHAPEDTLKLLLNGSEVSALNFESMDKNTAGTIAVSRWRGVDLREGDNHFELIVYDTAGKKIDHLKRIIHCSGPPSHAEVVKEQSNLIADGRATPVIAVRLTDKDGYPLREGMVGTFSVDPPYAAEEELDALRKNPLSGMGKEKPRYVVGKNGIALLRLEATSRSGEALVRVPLADDEEEELRAWMKAEARDWILVGLAEGTMGYNTVSGHMENANDADVDEDLYEDGRIAFFAKGKIKGEWLLTMAYDNKKTREEVGNSLHQTIDPDTYYTLYGDETEQRYDAASARKLYLKIERDQFYALFGDYDTGLTVTELSRYSRSLNGFKSEMKAENFSYSFFVSETNQAFVKDEIRGDGTSGLYHLSRKKIVMNSEKIVIEIRDRFRSEVVVSTRALSRHLDYNIDYDAGTLFFREPIYSKDENLNPVFIVVDYESYDATDEEYTYGGRGAVNLLDNTLEIGATYIHEGPTGARADLGGVDATIEIGDKTELRGEFATSERIENGAETDGDAYLAELSHRSGPFDGQIYVKEQGTGFGLGQQKGSETGTRKIGADASYRITKEFTARGEAYRHFNLATDAERDL
ncbi:MAG: OmpA family protein, partial [Deltaproteobacteria bacterium]|nr:OmpA family protein [Deltaproteobacteria bacterium]